MFIVYITGPGGGATWVAGWATRRIVEKTPNCSDCVWMVPGTVSPED